MPPSPTVTLVIALNDLEAEETARLAAAAAEGVRVVTAARGWGEQPRAAEPDIGDGGPVLAVECPNPAWEARVTAQGRTLHIIDHHVWVTGGGRRVEDRGHPLASIEQVARLMGWPLGGAGDPVARWAAANDRGFWPALLDAVGAEEARAALSAPPRPWLAGAADVAAGVAAAFADAHGGEAHGVAAPVVPARVAAALAVRLRDNAVREAAQAGTTADDQGARAVNGVCAALRFLAGAAGQGRRQTIAGRRGGKEEAVVELIHADPDIAPYVLDALYLERQFRALSDDGGKGAVPVGVIRATVLSGPWHAGGPVPPPGALFHSGSDDDAVLARDLLEHLTGPAPAGWRRLDAAAGGAGGNGFLHVRVGLGGRADDLSALADVWLNNLLGLNRPLWRWTTRLFQVFRTVSGGVPLIPDPARVVPVTAGAQERAFLLEHVRPFLTPEGTHDPIRGYDPAIRSFRLCVPAGDDPALTATFPSASPITEPVAEVLVHFAYHHIVILEWAFGGEWADFGPDKADGDGARLWRRLLRAPAGQAAPERVATLAQLLDFNTAARQCYAPYTDDPAKHTVELAWGGERAALTYPGRVVPEQPEKPGGWLAVLVERGLAPFGLTAADVCLLLDERARLMTGAALVGEPPSLPAALARRDALFARLLDVWGAGETMPYDPAFNRAVLDELAYRRFERDGSLYGVDDHAFVLLGYGWFSATIIIPAHMEAVYRRLWLVAQVYNAVFCTVSRSIAHLSRRRMALEAGDPTRIEHADGWRQLAEDTHQEQVRFLGFANALWFDGITSQMQGIDLFRRMTGRLRLRTQYEDIRGELDRTDTLETTDQTRDHERRTERLGVLAAFTAGIYITVDTLNNLFPTHDSVGAALVMLAVGVVAGWAAALLIDRFLTGSGWRTAAGKVAAILRSALPRLKD